MLADTLWLPLFRVASRCTTSDEEYYTGMITRTVSLVGATKRRSVGAYAALYAIVSVYVSSLSFSMEPTRGIEPRSAAYHATVLPIELRRRFLFVLYHNSSHFASHAKNPLQCGHVASIFVAHNRKRLSHANSTVAPHVGHTKIDLHSSITSVRYDCGYGRCCNTVVIMEASRGLEPRLIPYERIVLANYH